MLGVEHADHAEEHPDAPELVITPLSCSLVGQRHPVYLRSGSLAAELYGGVEVEEPYYCNYGLNPEFEPKLEAAGLRITGRDADGAARVAELDGHPFFMITLYVFQARDQAQGLHPITRRLLSSAASQ